MRILTLKVELGTGHVAIVRGREAWALMELLATGPAGCSVFDIRAPRWSSYVHKLRKLGFMIDTVPERHRGRFPGYHARYVLREQVIILDDVGC